MEEIGGSGWWLTTIMVVDNCHDLRLFPSRNIVLRVTSDLKLTHDLS